LDRPDRHVLSSTGEDQNYEKDHPNRRVRNGRQYRGLSAAAAPMTSGPAQIFTALPAGTTVTNFYKQNVYDPSDNKIGDVDDVLIDKEGHVTAMIIGVGGFLGMGEKDVAIPFSALHASEKNNKWYLVLNTTKDALKAAPGFTYDKTKTTWVSAAR
jgi:sporulation protein YlmC with PRC-barrel domain